MAKTGIDSIRINGMTIEELPFAAQAHARAQLPLAQENARKKKIENILAGYPPQRVSYLRSRIRECEESILRMAKMRDQNLAKVEEYRGIIVMCEFRDKEIERIPLDDPERDKKIRELNTRFPPYNVAAMETQIVQFRESAARAEEVATTERKAIQELTSVLTLCLRRDEDLRRMGVTIR